MRWHQNSSYGFVQRPLSGRTGFALVELLVAISVLAIIAVLGWRGLDTIVRSRVILMSELEQMRGLQLAFAQLQNDCANLVDPTDIGGRAVLAAQQGRLTLVRSTLMENQPSRLAVIAYRFKEGKLTRQATVGTRSLAELDAMWASALREAAIALPIKLQSDVTDMKMRLWATDGTGWRDIDAGLLVAPASSTGRLELAGLEVELMLGNSDKKVVKTFLLGPV